jgi:hypothetical protein
LCRIADFGLFALGLPAFSTEFIAVTIEQLAVALHTLDLREILVNDRDDFFAHKLEAFAGSSILFGK